MAKKVSKSKSLAALKRLYAAEEGIPLRTAQDHAKKGHKDWKAFLARTGNSADGDRHDAQETVNGREGSPSGNDLQGSGGEEDERYAGMTDAERDEARSRELWNTYLTAAEHWGEKKEMDKSITFANLAANAYKLYSATKKDRVKDDIERRNLVPAGEFEEFRVLVGQVAQIMQRIKAELALKVNPKDPAHSQRAIDEWIHDRWNPAIDDLMAAAE